MARLWLAVALCVVIFLVLANDAEARRKKSCAKRGRKGVRSHNGNKGHYKGHRKGSHKSRNVGHRKGKKKGCKGSKKSQHRALHKALHKALHTGNHKSHHAGHKGRKAGKCRKRSHGHGHKAHTHKARKGRNKGKGKCAKKHKKHGWKRRHSRNKHGHGGKYRVRHRGKKRKCGKSKTRHGHRHHGGSSSHSHHKHKNHHAKHHNKKHRKHRGRHSRSGSSSSHKHHNKRYKNKKGGNRKPKRHSSSSSSSSSSSDGNHGHRHINKHDKNVNRNKKPKRIDSCASNPCQNGAKCTNKRRGYRCRCKPGFRGKRCARKINTDRVSPCDNNPCMNRGNCIPRGKKRYRCKCDRGFSGTNCENAPRTIDVCADVTCHNGGDCVPDRSSFRCSCPHGFKGTFCEIEIPKSGPCEKDPCTHGGFCHDDGRTFWCTCPDNWTGLRCNIAVEHAGPCDDNPCKNYAQCVPRGRTLYRCMCKPGYSGKNCNIAPPKNPCEKNPCENGGSCVALQNGDFSCKCLKGFKGTMCDTGEIRPGTCPVTPPSVGGICVQECDSDSKCPGEEKCCSNGCGHVCRKPCGPMCRRWCANGFVYENGCPLCKCNDDIEKPVNEVERPKPKVADVVGKETLAYDQPLDFSKGTRIVLSVIWDTDLRFTFKHLGSPDAFYVIYIGWETAHFDVCKGEECKTVKDAMTKDILHKSAVSITFYIRFEPDGDVEVGVANPDYELMSYHSDNPETGQANMFISAGGEFPVDWDMTPPVIEQNSVVETSTRGDDTIRDLILKPIDTSRSSKLRFSVIGGDMLQIGLKSVDTLKKYIIVHIGRETSSIEICDEDKKCVTEEEQQTEGKLNDKHFVNYFIIFGGDGSINVAYEDTETVFLTYENTDPKPGLYHVFISSGGSLMASWKMHESSTMQEDTITWRSHNVEQNDKTWTFISEPIRDFEKEIQVGAAADKEVHIALMAQQTDTDFYEFVIGAESNTKLIIKKGGTTVNSARHVLSITSMDVNFSDYWISWFENKLCIGSIVESKKKDVIVCANDKKDYNFKWAGFKGDFMDYIVYYSYDYSVSQNEVFSTYDSRMAYPMRFKRAKRAHAEFNKLEFGVMTDSDAHLAVSNCQGADRPDAPMYELVMGSKGSGGCFFRKCKGCKSLIDGSCPGLLDNTEHKEYTFEFGGGHLRFYRGRGALKSKTPLLSWDDPHPLPDVGYLATSTGFYSSGSSHWILYHSDSHHK